MSKKLIFAAPLCAIILMFASCSLFSDDNEGTSVSFTIDSQTAQSLIAGSGLTNAGYSRSGLADLNGLYINMCLRGSYQDSQFARITGDGLTLSFDGIPVGETVYAYAEIYSTPSDVQYKGKSATIEIERGDNELQLNLMNSQAFGSAYPNEPANTNNPDPTAISSGNGGRSVPADFVLVEGMTVNTAISGSYVFIDERTIPIPDMYVCSHELTQKEYAQYCLNISESYALRGGTNYYETSKPSDSYGKGDDYPMYEMTWYQAIVYCNARSKAEGKEQVYYLTPEGNDPDGNPYNYRPVYDIDEWTTITRDSGSNLFFRKHTDGRYYTYSTDRLNSLNHPLVGIKMDTTKNGYRLLTEAEWEYCARGGKYFLYSQYSGNDDNLSSVAHYNSSSLSIVKQKDPNNLGLYDMCGNVYEWVFDVSNGSITATTPATGYVGNNANDTVSRVCRGGSYANSNCTIYGRDSYTVESHSSNYGIRICCNAN